MLSSRGHRYADRMPRVVAHRGAGAVPVQVDRPSDRVAKHRARILDLVAEHHGRSPAIVGSVARGEDGPESDVDLLVEFDDDASLLDLIGLQQDLRDLLSVPVDVIDARSLHGPVGTRMAAEKRPL